MLGIGWGEMLVIAIVLLVAVGPKELPVMLRNLGRMMGTVRRMSNEFRREIDRAVAAEEFREARKAISDPLKQTSDDISREFNAIRDGKVEPSGKLKPADPDAESVVDEIHQRAGLPPPAKPNEAAAAAALSAGTASQASAARPGPTAPPTPVAPAPAASKTQPAAGGAKPAAKASSTTAPAKKARTGGTKSSPAKKSAAAKKSAPAKKSTPAKSAGKAKPEAASDSKTASARKPRAKKPATPPASED